MGELKKQYLMTPGPTPIPPRVLQAESRPIIHHRTREYSDLFAETLEDLKYVFQTQNEVLIFASSGTGAMESAVANLFSPGDKVIVPTNGKFGDRFVAIAEAYGLFVVELRFDWGQVVDSREVEKALDQYDEDVKGVLVVQSETSTGVLNDVRSLGAMLRDRAAILVVDSITGIGAVECRTDEWGLDVVMTGSQKGLMMPPGLACIAVSPKAWAACERSTLPKYYFSWQKAKKGMAKPRPETPFTPAISLVTALRESLKMMREEQLENIIRRHSLLAEAARKGLEAMGLKLFASPEGRGSAVTPAFAPAGIDGEEVVKRLQDRFGITIAGGQDHMKGKMFRIGHLGYYDKFDIITTLVGLELVLSEMGHPVSLGAAARAAENVFARAEVPV